MMANWWRKRSLRLRLTLWYAATSLAILFSLGVLVQTLVGRRLGADLDGQLRGDAGLIASRLERDGAGRVRWDDDHEDARDPARPVVWFEVWSPEGKSLLRRGPGLANGRPPGDTGPDPRFSSDRVGGRHVRVLERATRVEEMPVLLRVLRSERDLRHALAQVGTVLALGLPLAALLSATGGYLIARRSLAPLGEMSARARQITAERLSARLPMPNPHDELGQLATVFNDTFSRLEGSFAELRRFAADASHELRTPLAALRAVGEASLRESGDEAARREAVGSMLEEAQRLGELVDALLLLARGDSDPAAGPRLEST